ncbi:BolA domain UV induced protein Uvi31 [Exserohilum turcicum]
MFTRHARLAGRRFMSAMAQSMTPMEDALRTKITEALKPASLEIFNDSHKHAHHKAMQGVTSRETHFRVYITSSAFQGKMQLARHRMVNSLMKDELAKEGGIHALQLTTRTPEEDEARQQSEAAKS